MRWWQSLRWRFHVSAADCVSCRVLHISILRERPTGSSQQRQVVAAGPVVWQVGDDGTVRVYEAAARQEVVGYLLRRDPDVDGAKDLHLVYRAIFLAPLVKLDMR